MTPPLTSIAAWLVFATALPSDASQTVTAIPFASFEHCERKIEHVLRERRLTIKPYCTNVAPTFWVPPRESF